jgi:hypothetical protein
MLARMPALNIMGTLSILKPEIVKEAEKMRKKGNSFEVIARMVSQESGLYVSGEVVRRYFAPDKPAEAPLDGTGYVHD